MRKPFSQLRGLVYSMINRLPRLCGMAEEDWKQTVGIKESMYLFLMQFMECQKETAG